MRGATIDYYNLLIGGNISIHAPHAGRDYDPDPIPGSVSISIHAPHAGRDYRLSV